MSQSTLKPRPGETQPDSILHTEVLPKQNLAFFWYETTCPKYIKNAEILINTSYFRKLIRTNVIRPNLTRDLLPEV